MKKLIFILSLLSVTMVACNNTSNNGKQETKHTTPIFLTDQSEGSKIVQKLIKKYGNDVTSNPTSPSFLEGMYFSMNNYLVLQVRGDSAAIRDSLEKVTGSKLFHLEVIKGKQYSQKELNKIADEMRAKQHALKDEVLKENIIGSGVTSHHIYVTLIRNTPEMRKAFREKVLDSPAIKFESSVSTKEHNAVYTSDTLGISLRPEYSLYADTAPSAPIILLNNSTENISCGEYSYVTYQGNDGKWRILPDNTNVFSVEYIIFKNGYHRMYPSLHPKLNNNKPGKYRFYYDIDIEHRNGSRTPIKLMTEFTLTDDYEAVKNAKRLKLPETKDERH